MANSGARVTTAAENPLCAKLQTKYQGRIAQACDPRRVERPRSERMTKAQEVADPFAATVEFVPAKAKAAGASRAAAAEVSRTSQRRTADAAARRVRAYEKTTPFVSGAYAEAYRRAADIRARAYDGSEAAASVRREKARRKANEEPTLFSRKWFRGLLDGRNDEVKVKSSPISAGAIIAILVVAAAVLMIIFSLSEINSFKRDISELEAEKQELCAEIDKYNLLIDRKNDIHIIEKAATEDIGMVKSSQVESRYITLSGGERVEVMEGNEKSAEDEGIFSTLLSTFGNNWDTLRDYID